MKFISKSSNLLIVLIPGLQAQPMTGTPAKPTISVRFKDGIADVQQEELVEMMVAHPGFNSDFISAEGVPEDPFAGSRVPSEPAHILTEMKFGTPVARVTKGGTTHLSPEIQKLVQAMAADMANKMLPGMVESTIKQIVNNHNETKSNTEEATEDVSEQATPEKKVTAKETKAAAKPKAKVTEPQETEVVQG